MTVNDVPTISCKRFGILGLTSTRHGYAILSALLAAKLFPRVVLLAAATTEQLALSKHKWHRYHWLRTGRRLATLRRYVPWLHRKAQAGDLASLCHCAGIPFTWVPGLDSAEACAVLRAAEVDTCILAEAPVIKGPILDTIGAIINFHPAPLPCYRGSNATYWTLYNDDPLEVSAHLVQARVDCGPIIAVRPLPVFGGDTLASIDARAIEVAAALAVDVLGAAKAAPIQIFPQAIWQGTTYRGPMPADILAECERRLRDGEFTHFVTPTDDCHTADGR